MVGPGVPVAGTGLVALLVLLPMFFRVVVVEALAPLLLVILLLLGIQQELEMVPFLNLEKL
jgi:hypothetical protein